MTRSTNQDRKHQLEIQIHPSDIQKGVRYVFLSRAKVMAWVALGLAWVGFIVGGLALAPAVIKTHLQAQERQAMLETRQVLGERLIALERRLGGLNDRSAELNLRMNKIYLAYGLANDSSIGQGGYPGELSIEGLELPGSFGPDIERTATAESEVREQIRVLEAFLSEIQTFEDAHTDQVRTVPSMSPLQDSDFRLTSPFGMRRSPFTKKADFHAGLDLAAHTGVPIYAPADGKVTFAGRYPLKQSVAWWRYGNMVSLRHGDRFITLFGHMDQVEVRTGQRVRQGDIIGTVGNTGWSTNPHLHYEIRQSNEDGEFTPLDPRIYMLDHRWSDEEELLVRARQAPSADFEPLPRLIQR